MALRIVFHREEVTVLAGTDYTFQIPPQANFLTLTIGTQLHQTYITFSVGALPPQPVYYGKQEFHIPVGAGYWTVNSPQTFDAVIEYSYDIGEGPRGDQGPQGPPGMVGPEGPEGPQGEQGARGVAGPTGPMGPQGPIGQPGQSGAAGSPGPQGAIGPAGPTGPEGEQGPAGPQGAAGATGSQGPQGTAGAPGFIDAAINFIMDGGGSVIATGLKGYLEIPAAMTINRWTLIANGSGNIVVDVWKSTYAAGPPAAGNSITASAKPTITGAVKNQSSTLTGWTTALAAGDILAFNVDSCSGITRCTISLKCTKV